MTDAIPKMGAWQRMLAPYRTPSNRRAALELALTAVPFVASWLVGVWAARSMPWLAVAVAPVCGAFLMRMFIIQHDCGHGAFFRSKALNTATGRLVSLATMVPYAYWRRSHSLHHAGNGNLAKRGFGDIWTMTVREYEQASRWERFQYRFYRNPWVMFGVGPAFQFLLLHRLPVGTPSSWKREWSGVHVLNVMLALVLVTAFALGFGWSVLAFHTSVALLTATAGVWLFYVQHQFTESYFESPDDWRFEEAAIRGSSFYDLPAVLRWVTGNIGYHHIHHLAPNIPFYRLIACHADVSEVVDAQRLTIGESVECAHLRLWDEEQEKMLSIRQAREAGYDV